LVQLVAPPISLIYRHFQSAAARCKRSVETFNPKVGGSNPPRPIGLAGASLRGIADDGRRAYRRGTARSAAPILLSSALEEEGTLSIPREIAAE
jgi:hypothetical protein